MTFIVDPPPTFPLPAVTWPPALALPVRVEVSVVRLSSRWRCSNCQARRVLYRIALLANEGVETTDARCRACWGMLA